MAGAYRCPVCGIDFPAGTPGAPKAPPGPDDIVEPGDLDFTEALREATGGREPKPAPEPAARPEPAAEPVAPDEPDADDIADDAVFEVDEVAAYGTPEARDTDELNIAPGAARGTAPPVEIHESGDGTVSEDSMLNVRPREEARARGGAGAGALAVRPVRTEGAMVAAAAETTALAAKTPRRRARSRSLAGTLLVALVLIGGVAGGVWWVGQKVGVPVGGTPAIVEVTAVADDGWVSLPTEEQAFVVSAGGPFRMRVDGKVYTFTGGRPVRVPSGATASLKVPRGDHQAVARAVAP